jgi:RimJ/RimL family protein N-acetyltransferase
MIIREIIEADAEVFLNLARRIDDETRFMMYEPGERQTTVEQQVERIRAFKTSDNKTMFVAEHGGQLVGYLGAMGGNAHRAHHTVEIFIGILEAYTGQGIGRRLFEETEKWARARGLHRLELTVMPHNTRGLALYQKMGFEIEGTKKHSLRVEGVYVDEICMGKLLV